MKDERNLDKFDRVFGHVFKGLERWSERPRRADIPREWLRKISETYLTEEEKAQIEALGGFDKLMETLAERLKEQQKRHEGGNKWIGTGGTSPFGAYGYNPEGVRIGQDEGPPRSGGEGLGQARVQELDDSVELGTRNIKVALRRLRRWVREGAADELDLDGTIRGTAEKGYLDMQLRPERRNKVRVLLFLDIGGSMDSHVEVGEELFSAARAEFKHMEHYYFHNCLYERCGRTTAAGTRRRSRPGTCIHKFPPTTRSCSSATPHEPLRDPHPGGSVEHWNEEAGAGLAASGCSAIYEGRLAEPHARAAMGHTPSIA